MIDCRNVLPFGARMFTNDHGQEVIGLYAIAKGKWWALPAGIDFDNIPKGVDIDIAMTPDFIANEPRETEIACMERHPAYADAVENHIENFELFKAHDFETAENVIICGAGPSLRDDIEDIAMYREDFKVITVGRSQNNIRGDYYVGLEPLYAYLNPEACRGTVAHLATTVNQGTARYPWDAVTWGRFVGFDTGNVDTWLYHSHGNVSCMAFEFAVKALKSRKVILVGMDHPHSLRGGMNGYFLHGLELSAMAWWAARHGVMVYNCSRATTVLGGVILATIEEAVK